MPEPGYVIKFNGYEFDIASRADIDIEHVYTEAGAYLHTNDTISIEGTLFSGCLASGSGLMEKLNYTDGDRTKAFVFKSDAFTFYDNVQAALVSFTIDTPDINKQNRLYTFNAIFSIISYNTGLRSLTKEEDDDTKYPIVASVTDNYTLEASDKKHINMKGEVVPLMKLTRNIGAVGIQDGGDKPPIWKAKKWIKDRQAFSSVTGLSPLRNWNFYNHERKIDEDVVQGGYNITDTFLATPAVLSGDCIHNYTIEMSHDIENDLQIAKIKGTVEGCEPAKEGEYGIGSYYYEDFFDEDSTEYYKYHISPTVSGHPVETEGMKIFAYDNAYSIYTGLAFTGLFFLVENDKEKRNQYFLDVSTDPLQYMPVGITEGFNIRTASISYEYTYNNRMDTLVPGALVENFSVSNSTGVLNKKFKHPIIGRPKGPVIVCPKTSSGVSTKTLSYEGIFPPYTGLSGYSYSQKIKEEVYGVLTFPLREMLLMGDDVDPPVGYIESYDTRHNLGDNIFSATLKFVYNNRCY